MLPVESPYKTYTGLDGKPLNNGYVYFGLPNQNPITAPVTVYWDAAGTIPAKQPLRTINGYIERAGTPANVFFDGSYSELVRDSKHRQVFYARNSDEFSLSALVKGALEYANNGTPVTLQAGLDLLYYGIQNVRNKRFAGGAKGDGSTSDSAAFQAAADAAGYGGNVYIPQGQYFQDKTIILRGATKLSGDGVECTVITRTGDYGDTFICGSINDQSEPARSFGARGIRFTHGTPYSPGQSTLDHIVTKGCHLHIYGAQEALIEDCWIHRMRYGAYFEGGSWVKVINCQFTGVYDPATPALQEGISQLTAAYSAIHGNPTTWIVKGNNFLGATYSRVVNYPTNDGLKPVNRVATIGSQYGFLIDGLEDLDFSGNYLGGQNIAELAFIPSAGGSTIDIRVIKNFFDGISEGQGILVAPAIANKSVLAMTIGQNTFVDNLHAILINQNVADNQPSVFNATICENTCLSGIGSQMQLNGAKGFVASGNTISDYNKYGFTATDANYTSAMNIFGTSAMGQVTGNTVGAGSNLLLNDVNLNQCYAGIVNACDSVYVGQNQYNGIRDLGNFRTGMSGDENQVTVTTGTYQIKSADAVILINRVTDAVSTVALPLYPVASREVVVKDIRGNAGAFPLTVTTNDSTLIDGALTNVIVTNYGFRRFRFNGNQWNVIG